MGKRLTGFDYSAPFYYMVTMKCLPGVEALSRIVAPGTCALNAITRAELYQRCHEMSDWVFGHLSVGRSGTPRNGETEEDKPRR